MESIVVGPDLGDDAGIVGAFDLARPIAAPTPNAAFCL
jgi:hypothetical protein